MASTFTAVQFMDPPGGPGVTGAVKAGSGIAISADGTISTQQGGGIVKTITGTNGITTAGTTDVIVSLNPPTSATIGGVRTVSDSGISIDSQGVIRSVAQFSILAGTGISVTNVTPISSTVSVNPAGTTASNRGGVWLDLNSGLSLTSNGALSLSPATTTKLGGVKVGSGLSITPDGVLTVSSGSGTITQVIAGTGLTGGGSAGAVTLNLNPPSATVIGGVKAGTNITIDADGTINASGSGAGVATVTGSAPILIGGTASNPIVNIQSASTVSSGAVQLYEGVDSTSSTLAPTANALRLVSEAVSAKLPLSGGTLTGALSVSDGSFNYIEFYPDGRAYIEGPAGVGVAPDGAYGLTLESRTVGSLRTFGALPHIIVDTTGGGTNGQLAFKANGTATFTITANTAGATSLLTNASTDLVLGTGSNAYLKIAGLDGQLTVNSSTPNSFSFPTARGTNGEVLVSDGAGSTYWAANVASGALPLSGGTMSGDITFNSGQTFPGTLPLSGGTMTGTITFAAGQTISGYVANSLYASTGALTYASGVNTPATLNVGANGNILGVNAGLPAWRTAAQLGLLTTAAASTTYATIDSPSFTGPATVNAGAGAGGNALTISGGNLVLATQFTPPSSSSTGSVGELAWDNAGYLYFCYAANTWGRVQIDLTPF